MAKVTTEEQKTMSRIEDIVCEHFGIDLSKIVSMDLTNDTVMARNFLFYVLHYNFSISISKISGGYFRKERSVKAQISKTKFCIKNNNVYKSIYSDLMDKIEATE